MISIGFIRAGANNTENIFFYKRKYFEDNENNIFSEFLIQIKYIHEGKYLFTIIQKNYKHGSFGDGTDIIRDIYSFRNNEEIPGIEKNIINDIHSTFKAEFRKQKIKKMLDE